MLHAPHALPRPTALTRPSLRRDSSFCTASRGCPAFPTTLFGRKSGLHSEYRIIGVVRATVVAWLITVLALSAAAETQAQPEAEPGQSRTASSGSQGLTAERYVPIDLKGRIEWIVDGTVGPRSLFVV